MGLPNAGKSTLIRKIAHKKCPPFLYSKKHVIKYTYYDN